MTTKKTKELNNGELKRLSIAEEMVHGPKLLLMDEPLTNISLVESSILTMCFREMVNQDRTVVATVHQPHAEIVKLFDTMLLLSRGRVIYYGTVSNASQYFISSPFGYNLGNYTNPADFLADISGGYLADCKGEFVDSSILEHYYKQSEVYGRLRNRMKKFDRKAELDGDISNPINSRGSDLDLSISSMPDACVSVDRDNDDEKESSGTVKYIPAQPKAPLPLALQGLYLISTETATIFSSRDNLYLALFKGRILFTRSVLSLSNRVQLIVSSNVLHIFLAILFGWVMGDSSGNEGIYNTTAFFALSAMFLILTNIPMSFYMFNNHGVFLKEHARGLYPNVLRWIVLDHPLNFLRVMNSIIFYVVAWAMINQTTIAGKLHEV
ncbi:hypothetical protein EON64_03670 [archaeon]|nr:MAG: hypothetical protein EON64_03670 [archaeon]